MELLEINIIKKENEKFKVLLENLHKSDLQTKQFYSPEDVRKKMNDQHTVDHSSVTNYFTSVHPRHI